MTQTRTPIDFDKYEAIIFDLDGTLIDSMWLWGQIDIDYLGRVGLVSPPDLQACLAGMSVTETARYIKDRFGITDPPEKMISDWNDMAMDYYMHKIPLKKGADAFLKAVRKRGLKTGIASSNSMELIDAVLDGLNIRTFFDSIHITNEVAKGKPSPDIYNLVAGELGVDNGKCLVFEDIKEGVMAGQAAGMEVCGVFDDFADTKGGSIKDMAEYFINDFTEIVI